MDNKDNIKRLFDMSKVLKGNTVSFYNNRIMSLNSDIYPISSISVIYTDTMLNIPNYGSIKFEVLKNIVNEEVVSYLPLHTERGIKEAYILDNFREPDISQMLYKHEDLKSIDEFNISLSKKAKDGADLIYIDRFPISLCSGLLPVNKSDKISLEIYDDNVPKTFLAKFIIDKKKYTINKYIRYLYLEG